MRNWKSGLVALALLAACDGNPFQVPVDPVDPVDPTAPPDTDGDGVPDSVQGDLNAMSFNGSVLKIDMAGVSSSGQMATFTRKRGLDIPSGTDNPGYAAYVYQDTALTRSYVAYVAENERGNLVAVAAADGGQFNEHNFGGYYYRVTGYKAPNTADGPEQGLFTYMGSYVGIFSPGDWADGSGPRPPEFRPVEPWTVTGTMQINGDFAHATVEGGVTDRELFDQDGNQITEIAFDNGDGTFTTLDTTELDALVLRETAIDEDGYFVGNVEFFGAPDGDIGDYGGAFGGQGATDVAGVLWLNPITGQSGIWESGAFNLPSCSAAGASPLCTPR